MGTDTKRVKVAKALARRGGHKGHEWDALTGAEKKSWLHNADVEIARRRREHEEEETEEEG